LQHSRFTESIITTAAAGREPHSLHKRSVTETNEKVSSKSSHPCNALVSVPTSQFTATTAVSLSALRLHR
jgi:hypothetical protein